MKFIHLGDLHLGKSLAGFDLIEDQSYILDRIIELAADRQADAVLIAGDVYDKAVPSEAATRLLDHFLCRLSAAGVKVFMISGNHDSDDRLNYGRELFKAGSIFISAVFDGELHKETVSDEYGELDIYMLPFVKASQVRHFYPDAKIDSYEDAVRTVIEQADIDAARRNVIIAHQFVTGNSADPELGGSEGLGTQSVGLVEKIGFGCFDAFDYTALGHIHAPQKIGRDTVRYSGSPLKYSLSEVSNLKSVPLVTLAGKGEVQVELVPLKPLRDLRHLKGPMNKLLAADNISSPEDFIYATLTDEDAVNDAIGIFRQTYPNTVRIDYDNSHTRAIEHTDITAAADNKTFSELTADFYRLIYGCEMSEEELLLMREAAKEAGITDETD